MSCVAVTEGHSGDGCVLASTLCKYAQYFVIASCG